MENELEMELKKDAFLKVGIIGRNSTTIYSEISSLLIEDNPEKMLAYYNLTERRK